MKRIVFVVLAAALAVLPVVSLASLSGCAETAEETRIRLYYEEQHACVTATKTREESDQCTDDVRRRYGRGPDAGPEGGAR